jgi:hypothetical protein
MFPPFQLLLCHPTTVRLLSAGIRTAHSVLLQSSFCLSLCAGPKCCVCTLILRGQTHPGTRQLHKHALTLTVTHATTVYTVLRARNGYTLKVVNEVECVELERHHVIFWLVLHVGSTYLYKM